MATRRTPSRPPQTTASKASASRRAPSLSSPATRTPRPPTGPSSRTPTHTPGASARVSRVSMTPTRAARPSLARDSAKRVPSATKRRSAAPSPAPARDPSPPRPVISPNRSPSAPHSPVASPVPEEAEAEDDLPRPSSSLDEFIADADQEEEEEAPAAPRPAGSSSPSGGREAPEESVGGRDSEEDNASAYSDGFSFVGDKLRLEGELKSKEYQLNGLIQETARLERALSKKDQDIFELNGELHRMQERILRLEQELETKSDAASQLTAQLAAARDKAAASHATPTQRRPAHPRSQRTKDNEAVLQHLDARFQESRSLLHGDSEDSLPEELYRHVLTLNNQLTVLERQHTETTQENLELKRRCKELELFSTKATQELEAARDKAQEQKLSTDVTYAERIAVLSRRERKLQEELRTLRSNDQAKSKRIATLEALHVDAGDLEQAVAKLKQERRAQDMKIADLKRKLTRLTSEGKSKDAQLARVTDKNRGVPMNIWLRDRDLLQGKVKQMKDALDAKDKTIEAQRQRILELCDRVDLIAASLQELDPEVAQQSERACRINGTFRTPLSGSSTASRGHAPVLQTALRSEKTLSSPSPSGLTSEDLLLIDDDGEEAELTDDLFDYDPQAPAPPAFDPGERGSDTISTKLYELLEREVQALRVQSQQQAQMLQDKDHTIQTLEAKYDKLAKHKVINADKETEKIVEKMSTVEQENKKREKQYRLQIHKLQQQHNAPF